MSIVVINNNDESKHYNVLLILLFSANRYEDRVWKQKPSVTF